MTQVAVVTPFCQAQLRAFFSNRGSSHEVMHHCLCTASGSSLPYMHTYKRAGHLCAQLVLSPPRSLRPSSNTQHRQQQVKRHQRMAEVCEGYDCEFGGGGGGSCIPVCDLRFKATSCRPGQSFTQFTLDREQVTNMNLLPFGNRIAINRVGRATVASPLSLSPLFPNPHGKKRGRKQRNNGNGNKE